MNFRTDVCEVKPSDSVLELTVGGLNIYDFEKNSVRNCMRWKTICQTGTDSAGILFFFSFITITTVKLHLNGWFMGGGVRGLCRQLQQHGSDNNADSGRFVWAAATCWATL